MNERYADINWVPNKVFDDVFENVGKLLLVTSYEDSNVDEWEKVCLKHHFDRKNWLGYPYILIGTGAGYVYCSHDNEIEDDVCDVYYQVWLMNKKDFIGNFSNLTEALYKWAKRLMVIDFDNFIEHIFANCEIQGIRIDFG